jgi:uncharacterized membrane protein YhhN
MSSAAWILLVIAAGFALVDWWAVVHRPSSVEYVAKPAALVALVGVALVLAPFDGTQRAWFVGALVLSLAGDVFLLPKPNAFVPGLGSFLLAHVAYVVGFGVAGRGDWTVVGVVFILALLSPGASRVVRTLRRDDPPLVVPVVVYIVAISAMVASAYLHGDSLGFVGAVTFAGSDTVLALDRFVEHRRHAPLAVMVTYHVAQALLVLSLLP